MGNQKNHLIEMVLLSTHNICFDYMFLGAQKKCLIETVLIETVLLSTHNICFVC